MLDIQAVIAESLAGKRIAITGSTGFVGTALVERLLRCVPGCELVLLVRDGKRTAAPERVRKELLKNDAFDRLRESARQPGAEPFDEMTARRITTITGDVGRDGLGLSEAHAALLAACDVVVHSAATVSFDSPLDGAVEINLLGATRIAELLHQLGATPHLIAVSTCYVAGNRRGRAPEELVSAGPFDLGLNWRSEVTAARRLRSDSEAASRQPDRLAELRKEARSELGAAGAPALAAKTEQLRERWVRDRLIEAGRARAASVGWPDAYAFTKALGEQALTDTVVANGNDVPISIVRPSIIESSWAEPTPGWIRGFRMAEPVIISYARGLLREFPGVPEGTVDVIPVDLVVAALITVAALGPDAAPAITQVASGGVNPLKYKALVDNVSGWFTEHPIYDPAGQPIVVPEWRFPGRGRVQGQLTRAKSVLTRGERLLHSLPLRGKQAELSAKLETKRQEVERALEYVELYGLYTECEAIYQVDNLLAMWGLLDDADRAEFNFDPRSVDWDHYVREIHLPSVVKHARVKTEPGKTTTDRTGRLRRQVLSPNRHLAAFDLENTLIASNVVESYSWMATRRLDQGERLRYVLRTLAEAPRLLKLDRVDRTDFLRHFYRRYENAPVEQIDGRRRRAAHPGHPHEELSGRAAKGSRAQGARSPHGVDHRCPRLRGLRVAAAVRRDHRGRDVREGRRHVLRPDDLGATDRRGPGTGDGRVRGRRGPRPRGERRLRRLDERPADARGGRLPGSGQPGDQAGRTRPQAGLARRAVVQGIGQRDALPDVPDRPRSWSSVTTASHDGVLRGRGRR